MSIFTFIKKNDINSVKRLIDSGTNINQEYERGYTPLLLAVGLNLNEMAELLINSGANINLLDNFFWSPLHQAVCNNNIKLVELLCNNGANLNANYGSYKWTPLHLAVDENSIEIALFLIEYGADYTMKTLNNQSIFDLFKNDEHKRIITNKIIELKLQELWILEVVDQYESYIQWLPRELLEDSCSLKNE